jgi:hypothetical protein
MRRFEVLLNFLFLIEDLKYEWNSHVFFVEFAKLKFAFLMDWAQVVVKALEISEDKGHVVGKGTFGDGQLVLFTETEEVVNAEWGEGGVCGMVLEGALEVGMRWGVEGFEGVGLKHKIE